jgi:hypothetical protein
MRSVVRPSPVFALFSTHVTDGIDRSRRLQRTIFATVFITEEELSTLEQRRLIVKAISIVVLRSPLTRIGAERANGFHYLSPSSTSYG